MLAWIWFSDPLCYLRMRDLGSYYVKISFVSPLIWCHLVILPQVHEQLYTYMICMYYIFYLKQANISSCLCKLNSLQEMHIWQDIWWGRGLLSRLQYRLRLCSTGEAQVFDDPFSPIHIAKAHPTAVMNDGCMHVRQMFVYIILWINYFRDSIINYLT